MKPPNPLLQAELVRQAIRRAWREGNLDFKRHSGQVKIKHAVESAPGQKRFALCSRRFGKSYEIVLQAIEACLTQPGARVVYLAPFTKNAAEIATDTMAQILLDCPPDLKPDFKSQSNEFIFKRNGVESILRLKGVNEGHAQFLRGGTAHKIFLDECGQMDDLRYTIQDVALPMTLTTNGVIVLASTPPRTPAHESAAIYEQLAGEGAAIKFTLRDAPHISHEAKLRYLIEAGEKPGRVEGILRGELEPETTTARREYFCEFVTDASSAVVPEFDAEAQREVVRKYDRPEYCHKVIAIDPGIRDRTGILYGYHDFREDKIVIEAEDLLHRTAASTDGIGEVIKERMTALWKFEQPKLMISDVDLRLQTDLRERYKLNFTSVDKKNSLGAINAMRDAVRSRRLVIAPECVHLVRQLKNAIWNKQATDFERPGDEFNVDGHFDLVAALKYLIRAVESIRRSNPFPEHYYERGGVFGLPQGAWQSPTRRSKKKGRGLELHDDTPTGRRMARGGARGRKRRT